MMARAKTGTCVHFTGIQNKTCKAGVNYDQISAGGLIPCFTMNGQRRDCCPTFLAPTAEELAAAKADREEFMKRFRLVMAVVGPWRSWTKKNRVAKQEVIECPACKGRLHLTQAAYNGHVWGKCETAGCVSWMQ